MADEDDEDEVYVTTTGTFSVGFPVIRQVVPNNPILLGDLFPLPTLELGEPLRNAQIELVNELRDTLGKKRRRYKKAPRGSCFSAIPLDFISDHHPGPENKLAKPKKSRSVKV